MSLKHGKSASADFLPSSRDSVPEKYGMNATKISFAVFMILSLATIAHGQITNPVLSHADPFITYEPVTRDGQYILTATGGAKGPGITLWSGTTPAGAAAVPHVIFSAPEGMSQIWSPTI